jgi:hypothetical protein
MHAFIYYIYSLKKQNMRKVFLSVAVLATLASCSQNEIIDTEVPMLAKNEIGFATLKDKVTRAASETETAYVVFSQLSKEDQITYQPTWFMRKLIVNSPHYGYDSHSGHFYWPGNDRPLDFAAISPSSVQGLEITDPVYDENFPHAGTAKGSVVLNGYTIGNTADIDLTIAGSQLNVTASGMTPEGSPSPGRISLPFSHMLAKVTITLAFPADLIAKGYTVGYSALGNPTLDVKYNTTDQEINLFTNPGGFSPVGQVGSGDVSSPGYYSTTFKGLNQSHAFYIIPQCQDYTTVGFAAASSSHQVTIEDENGNVIKSYKTSAFKRFIDWGTDHDVTEVPNFGAGKQYDYTFIIGPDEIQFASHVNEWSGDGGETINP